MKKCGNYRLLLILILYGISAQSLFAAESSAAKPLQCVAFSPYVGSLNPDYGTHPSRELIDALLDKIVAETPFRCIMTYGVLNGLEYTFAAAQARNLKVIAIIWIDKDIAVNTQSIASGIEVAKAFPDTIIKLSCGSEVRTRHNFDFDGEINRCITGLRAAGVKQPITTIDTWWEWCNRSHTCSHTSFATQVDWIGINIFPWWENKYADAFKCTPASKAADFHVARLNQVKKAYPDKEIIITEFGWPNGPNGKAEPSEHSSKSCGIANEKNQAIVIQDTLKKMRTIKQSAIVFEAFSEGWKQGKEGGTGSFWGLCQSNAPYNCAQFLRTLSP